MLLRKVTDRFVVAAQARSESGGRFSIILPATISTNSNTTRRFDREWIVLIECGPTPIAADSSSCIIQTVSVARNAGRDRSVFEACIYSLQGDVRPWENRIVLFRSSGCFGGSNTPAKRGNHHQEQEQSEPTHVTKSEYNTAAVWSTEIRHFGANMFWYVPARTRPCLY